MLRSVFIVSAIGIALVEPVTVVRAQSIGAISGLRASSPTQEGRQPKSLGSNNEWLVGTQLGVKFIGDGDFSDNLLVSGLVKYDIPLQTSKQIGLPVFSNIGDLAAKAINGTKADTLKASAAALLSTAQGMNVGLYPYWVTSDGANVRVTFFGQTIAKVNTLKGKSALTAPDTAKKVDYTMLQGRAAFGAEVAVGAKDPSNPGRRPLTLSLTGAITGFDPHTYELVFGSRQRMLYSIEMSAVVPVRDGAGVLFEGIGSTHAAGTWRVGMLIAAGKSSPRDDTTPAPDKDPKSNQPATGASKADDCLNLRRAELKKTKPNITDDEVKKDPSYAECMKSSQE